ncbi:MAG TPA: SDR family NAD(P)-dependent oxidoreductase [Victivallales bacterium]|nr:SDR family NAD(P)-dependent oxidoreductase [Victivallales bacterium]
MKTKLSELVKLSNFYGKNKDFVIGGGGNSSFKDKNFIYVKASGFDMGEISEDGFVKMSRPLIDEMSKKDYPSDPAQRERLVLQDMMKCCVDNDRGLRPSVEAPLHHLIAYDFVMHTHPTWINAVLCGNDFEIAAKRFFPSDVLCVDYVDPGYTLFKSLSERVAFYRKKNRREPKIILIRNHGIFVGADSPREIKSVYEELINKIKSVSTYDFPSGEGKVNSEIAKALPAIRGLLSDVGNIKILKTRSNALTQYFCKSPKIARMVSLPFTPDNIVYCKARPLYLDAEGDSKKIIREFKMRLVEYERDFGFKPSIILIKNWGLVAAGENNRSATLSLDVFEDLMKISYLSQNFGGPHFMTPKQIKFIEGWESENYRRKMSSAASRGKVCGKIAIITGAAQGFGQGIAEDMMREGANVVVADLNQEKGTEFTAELNKISSGNHAIFVKTDVSDLSSVEKLIHETVLEFGGLDVYVSNAGILRAGGLDELSPESFEMMTNVNYKGYYYGVRCASAVMRIQLEHMKGCFADIIQINSKSGLRGSKKNFSYAGGKFGGVGLTQSFALELIEHNIKVNSICPGNFFDGPLWSDPERGLFVQYLRAGKVPGAKNIADVKHFYEAQVPAGRGCSVKDVMRAIYYVIEQEYETGQAIPVTGGQVMLN